MASRRHSIAGRAKGRGWTDGALAGISTTVLCLALAGCGGMSLPASPETPVNEATPGVPTGAFELVETAMAEGRAADAARVLERIRLIQPKNARARLMLAELLLMKGKRKQAASAFAALGDDPEVGPRADQGLGIALMLADSTVAAVGHLRRAVEADPTLWRAWNALGTYYDTQGAWAKADEAYAAALAERPDNAVVYNNRGFSNLLQGRVEEATEDLEHAVRLDPALRVARVNLRLALAWSGRYVHAMRGVTEGEMARVLNNIGYVALMRGDLDNAEAYLLRAMETDPAFNATAWRNLARLRDAKEVTAAGGAGE